MIVKRGELYYADLSPVIGSEQGGVRPVLVVQNDTGNKYSPTVIAAAVTSKIGKARLPTHIELPCAFGLAKNSVILLEQIRTIDKKRLMSRIGELPPTTMRRVNRAILISLGFDEKIILLNCKDLTRKRRALPVGRARRFMTCVCYFLSLIGTYSLCSATAWYAGRMILPALTSSSMRCALQPAIRAMAKIGVYSSMGILSML